MSIADVVNAAKNLIASASPTFTSIPHKKIDFTNPAVAVHDIAEALQADSANGNW
jgi:hypothetical protein